MGFMGITACRPVRPKKLRDTGANRTHRPETGRSAKAPLHPQQGQKPGHLRPCVGAAQFHRGNLSERIYYSVKMILRESSPDHVPTTRPANQVDSARSRLRRSV